MSKTSPDSFGTIVVEYKDSFAGERRRIRFTFTNFKVYDDARAALLKDSRVKNVDAFWGSRIFKSSDEVVQLIDMMVGK